MKTKIIFLLLLFTCLQSNAQTLFSENMGSPSGTVAIATNTFQNSGSLSYSNGGQSNSADVRVTSQSSGYANSSGSGNVYFSSSSGAYGFSIEAINASNYTNLKLQFGYKKEAAASHATLAVDYWDGSSWVTVANTASSLFTEGASAPAVWYLSKSLDIPSGGQINGLKIRFVKTGGTAIRIDDVKLTGTEITPTVINTTVAGITANSATFAGNVTATGGATITATGTVYSVTATNSNPMLGGTGVVTISTPTPNSGTGTFSNGSGSMLTPNVQYSYNAYATKNSGVSGYGTVATFYSLADRPNAPIVSSATGSTLNVGIGSDANSVITTYAILEVTSGSYVQANGSLGTVAVYQTAAVWGVKTVTGLLPSTTYTFEVTAKNGAGITTTSGPSSSGTTLSPSNSSDIIFNSSSSTSSNSNIAYNLYQGTTLTNTGSGSGGSVGVMGFYLRDGGAGLNDADNLSTQLTAITFTVTHWHNLRSVRIFQGNTPKGTVVNVTGPQITFSGITDISVADNNQLALSLRVTFMNTVNDNEQMQFSISSVTAASSGSKFGLTNGGGASSSVSGDINRIEVTAGKLGFLQQPPASIFVNTEITPALTVAAQDSNENIDLDFTGTVTLTSSGALTSSQSGVAYGGVVDFAHIKHSLPASGIVLTATVPLLTPAVSNSFDVLTNPIGSGDLSPNGLLENISDDYGNRYKLSDLLINTSTSSTSRTTLLSCPNSIFNLYFEDGSGMENTGNADENARRAVICKVFEDLSNFINTPLTASGNKVNIWVRNLNNVPGAPANVAGLATGFYNFAESTTNGGIIDNEIWKTIHSGLDSYTNVVGPIVSTSSFYHGMLAFNFSGLNWHTDLSTNAGSNELDLYSVALHELAHALGFASLIDQNGSYRFGSDRRYYSRYDTFLKTNDSSAFLISNSGECGTMYNYTFNVSPTVLRPGCTSPDNLGALSTDNTNCLDAIKYVSPQFPSMSIPVYTPTCFETGSSLSHFEDQLFPNCSAPEGNNSYFVMSNSSTVGTTKRFLKPEEKQTLCDIGYSLKATFGTSSTAGGYYDYGSTACNGIDIAGINDGFTSGNFTYIGNVSTNIIINGTGILSNDINTDGFECLQDVLDPTATLNGSSNPLAGDGTTVINFSSSVSGIHLLRYVPINSSGQKGNITYVYVYVYDLGIIGTANCQINACNLIVNGDFEEYTALPTAVSQISYACGWGGAWGTPDYYNVASTSSNVSIPCNFVGEQTCNNSVGNGYAGLYTFIDGNHYSEVLASKLASPLVSGSHYRLSFDVSLAEGASSYSRNLQAYLSPTNIPLLPGVAFPVANNAMLFKKPVTSVISNGWERLTFDVIASGGEEYIYIGALKDVIIQPNPVATSPGCIYSNYNIPSSYNLAYYYLDNVSLVAVSNDSFVLPNAICNTRNLSDLTTFLSGVPTNGEFTGPGVVFTPNGITPTSGIYSFNAAAVSLGTYTIEYNYHNNLGCLMTVSDTVTVQTTGIVPEFNFLTNLELCEGSTPPILPTTSDNGITGTWGPTTTINTTSSSDYTFTPDPGQCSTATDFPVYILPANAFVTHDDIFTVAPGILTTGSVLANDTFNGNPMSTVPAMVIYSITPVGTPPTFVTGGITFNADGSFTVDPSTPLGTYVYNYEITSICGASNQSTVTITVAATPSITNCLKIYLDELCYNATASQTTLKSIFVDGCERAYIDHIQCDSTNVTIELLTPLEPGCTFNPDGTITIAAGTMPFIGESYYILRSVLNPSVTSVPLRVNYGILQRVNTNYTVIYLHAGSAPIDVYDESTNILSNPVTSTINPNTDGNCGLIPAVIGLSGVSNTVTITETTNPQNPYYRINTTSGFVQFRPPYSSSNLPPEPPLTHYDLTYTMCINNTGTAQFCNDGLVVIDYYYNDYKVKDPTLKDIDMVVYPNPSADGRFTLLFQREINNGTIEVYNLLGQKVKQDVIQNASEQSLDLSTVAKGTYLLRIQDGTKQVVKKVMIK